jgi:hypothetical protein
VFTHHCTACDRTQLIFPSQVLSLTAVAGGYEIAHECWCGATQVEFVQSGRPAVREVVAA